EGAFPLKTVGLPPAAAADIVLLNFASPTANVLKALQDPSGAEVWRLDQLKSSIRFAGFLEEDLLVADDLSIWRLNPRSGKQVGKIASKARMYGFALAGPLLVYLTEDPEPRVVALDAVRGAQAWSEPYQGTASPRVFVAGEAVVFTTFNPNRIHLFEVETGK